MNQDAVAVAGRVLAGSAASGARTFGTQLVAALFSFAAALPALADERQATPGGDSARLHVFAVGDGGTAGPQLDMTASFLASRLDAINGNRVVLYLGDNFYPYGLNGSPEENDALVRSVLVDSGLQAINRRVGRERVHAVAGNHEYYRHLLFGKFPVGFLDSGSADAGRIDTWTYHSGGPDSWCHEIGDGGRVCFFFFDSGRALARPREGDAYFSELERLLKDSGDDRVRWRFVVMHHPLRSRGAHGFGAGATEGHKWLQRVSWVHKQDLCSARYRTLIDGVREAIRRGGVMVHGVIAGHDHSLQLLVGSAAPDDPDLLPRIHVVSGAAAKLTKVRDLTVNEFTGHRGRPRWWEGGGFAELTLSSADVRIEFHGGDPRGKCMSGHDGKRFRSFQVSTLGSVTLEGECSVP